MAKKVETEEEIELRKNEEIVRDQIAKIRPVLFKMQAKNIWRLAKLGVFVFLADGLEDPRIATFLKAARANARDIRRLTNEQADELEKFVDRYIKTKKVGDIDQMQDKLKSLDAQVKNQYMFYKGNRQKSSKVFDEKIKSASSTLKKLKKDIFDEPFADFEKGCKEFGQLRSRLSLYSSALIGSKSKTTK